MKRTFQLKSTYDQAELHELEVTIAQSMALEKHHQPKITLAEIIRANWTTINETLRAFSCPGYGLLWHDGDRLANITDVESSLTLHFAAESEGPRISHEIMPAGSRPVRH